MPNTSATGGYLAQSSAPPAEGDDLDDILQKVVVGITGIDGTLVRPRWAANPLPRPERTVNWCAIGVTGIEADAFPAVIHHGTGDGYDELQRHETIDLLASFYGPAAASNAALFKDGLSIAQNREELFKVQMSVLETGRIIKAPDLLNNTWIEKYDVPVRFRRCVTRTYPVLNLLSAQGTVSTPDGTQPFTVTES
ncbi:hypothetical protein [Bosea sp. AS-1]|uniref:phage neck terminator protein n=1 Tax=Bosea sp. AS-1 TaxID=2015316 RepID=UPI000B7757A5|nr:hypothetical protein [Bosea sp. AS-1]